MKHTGILKLFIQTEQFSSFLQTLKKGRNEQLIHGVTLSQRSLWISAAVKMMDDLIVMITSDVKEAKEMVEDLSEFLPSKSVDYLSPREFLPYGVYAKSSEIQIQRLKVFQKLLGGKISCLVVPVEALMQNMIPKEHFNDAQVSLSIGQEINYEEMLNKFVKMGYERVDMVQSPSQFSARGGIIDIYSTTEEFPYRVELFDNEVESIRTFDVENQRSIDNISNVNLYPAREILFGEVEKERAISKIQNELQEIKNKNISAKKINELQNIGDELINHLNQGIWTEDMNSLQSYFYEDQKSIFDYLSNCSLVFMSETNRIIDNMDVKEKENNYYIMDWFEAGKALKGFSNIFLQKDIIIDHIKNNSVVHFSTLPRQIPNANIKNIISINGKTLSIMGKPSIIVDEIKNWKKNNYVIIIFTGNEERANRIKDIFIEDNMQISFSKDLKGPLYNGGCYMSIGNLQKGFEIPFLKFVILTDNEMFGRQKQTKQISKHKEGAVIRTFADLKTGDYVVHEQHGIGCYLGVVNIKAGGVQKDYFYIQYAKEDKLYLPADQVDLIQKYIGSEGAKPRLSKLGGNEWIKMKNRVKSSVQEIAKELLNLYAYREMLKGFAFSEDDEMQRQFEDEFPYNETPDQKKAIEKVKDDMIKKRLMDRLICGDVGYGKTEIAMRAAFKAIMDSKQVAILVPTTVLAQQHYQTFTERFHNYPVIIEMLSRFVTKKNQNETIKRIQKGKVDIIIGTHRLLSKDLKFKDLGLLIIDEEQRFGVTHKEKMKQLRKNIDVLTLSATPIPRTLHMALAGTRDMSIIETPPENRYPVQTYVIEFSSQLIRDAISKELERGGQVYFVHNRIEDMDKVKYRLQELVPEANIAVAHGKMREKELENVMISFMNGDYDVLLCTTIIENGLDISNVNTLIVDNADTMGLSQLYQIRGRVGRTNRLAYAYFTYRKDKVLTQDAEKRLLAIREFTEFGSGFKIAMRDLEIRGAGNILGSEQHGHMLAVGFDLYCKLLDEEVKKLKGEDIKETRNDDISIELNVDAYISDKYIEDSSIKMEIYRDIADAVFLDDLNVVNEEIIDRFGEKPEEVKNLISIARIKIMAQENNVSLIKQVKEEVTIKFNKEVKVSGEMLLSLAKHYNRRLNFSAADGLTIKVKITGLNEKELLDIIESIFYRLQNYKVGKEKIN